MWDFQKGDEAKKVGHDRTLMRNVSTVLLEMDAAGKIPADMSRSFARPLSHSQNHSDWRTWLLSNSRLGPTQHCMQHQELLHLFCSLDETT